MTITAVTRLGAVLGWPVAHSKSPALHNAAFAAAGIDAVFVALAVPPADVETVIRALAASGAIGASVTVPHKEAALAACTRVDPYAALAGAVNCLVFEGGQSIGHNTDAFGFIDGLTDAGIDARVRGGGRAVILGSGGAARAVMVGLADIGAAVTIVTRRPSSWCHARPWDELGDLLDGAALLVDCTSAGLAAETDRAFADAVPLDRLPTTAAVVTLVYHRPTELVARAAARGHATTDGAGMLLHQGARAFTLWTGRPAPLDVMARALH